MTRSAIRGARLNRVPARREPRPIFREKKKDHESNSWVGKTGGSGSDTEVEVELKILAIFHSPPNSAR